MIVGISDCIALAEIIIGAYKCWSNVPKEIADFMTLVLDLKTQIEALEESSAFESQILQLSERKFLCNRFVTTYSILSDFQKVHHEGDHQIIQRLRWLCHSKLKPLSSKMSRQIQVLDGFKQAVLLRAST